MNKTSHDPFASDGHGAQSLRDRAMGGVGGWLDEEEEGWRDEVGESYYLDMLRDDARNKAYRDGIARAISDTNTSKGSSSVLDIGTGSGLLAMMAKRSGLSCLLFPHAASRVFSYVHEIVYAVDVMLCRVRVCVTTA